jgi:hypothetical protein
MSSRTIAEREFQVQDARGRTYRIIHYVWQDNVAASGEPERWEQTWELFMSENGGYLEPLGGERYQVDGTGTLVEAVAAPRAH